MQSRGVVAAVASVALAAALTGAISRAAEDDGYSVRLGALVNEFRGQHGLAPLRSSESLADLAREHSQHMAREDRLSHDGFEQRFAKARSARCVENVGAGLRSPAAELQAWRNSPVHAHNLLDAKIARMGIAIENGFVTFFACR